MTYVLKTRICDNFPQFNRTKQHNIFFGVTFVMPRPMIFGLEIINQLIT